ncbi:MAG: short chain dehydrogenase [Deltaproteobacteria bacterium HGW-Deltaproteobacteria-14]|jgi:NAD(P)-dependent dehydrogenase (short-subunit alcohol dehydrogenase family)|nr:MAG: short chain dehydrogenase [Deltaproteobacteria bacterium HGW-Deltaproteobacteria-14]
MGRYDGLVAWVTGGGSGIGRALALELAREGADVAVSGRRLDRLEAVAGEIRALGRRALAAPCDVTDEEAVAAAVAGVVQHLGKLDVAVANAGYGVSGRFEKLTAADWRRQLEVNVVGAAVTLKAALPHLRASHGRAAVVASVAGMIALPSQGPYCASKFAVRAMGLSLAAELHGTGVSCTTIHPGFVASEINQVDNRGVFDPGRVDRRPKNLMWPADKAARVMARAIYARKREYVFTWHGKLGAWLGRHAPGLVHFAATRKRVRDDAARVSKA